MLKIFWKSLSKLFLREINISQISWLLTSLVKLIHRSLLTTFISAQIWKHTLQISVGWSFLQEFSNGLWFGNVFWVHKNSHETFWKSVGFWNVITEWNSIKKYKTHELTINLRFNCRFYVKLMQIKVPHSELLKFNIGLKNWGQKSAIVSS